MGLFGNRPPFFHTDISHSSDIFAVVLVVVVVWLKFAHAFGRGTNAAVSHEVRIRRGTPRKRTLSLTKKV